MSTFISAPNHIDLFDVTITSALHFDAALATLCLENVKIEKHQIVGFPLGESMELKMTISKDDSEILTFLRAKVTNKKVEYKEKVLEDDSIDNYVIGATVSKLIGVIAADGIIGGDIKTVVGIGYLSELTNTERSSGTISGYDFTIKFIKDYSVTVPTAKFDTDVWTTPSAPMVITCGIIGSIEILAAAA